MEKLNFDHCQSAGFKYWMDLIGKLLEGNAHVYSALEFVEPGLLWQSCENPGSVFEFKPDSLELLPGIGIIPYEQELVDTDGTVSTTRIVNVPVSVETNTPVETPASPDPALDYYLNIYVEYEVTDPNCVGGCTDSFGTRLRARVRAIIEDAPVSGAGLTIYKLRWNDVTSIWEIVDDLRPKLTFHDSLICHVDYEYTAFMAAADLITFPGYFSRLVVITPERREDAWTAATLRGISSVIGHFISEPWGPYQTSAAFFDYTYVNGTFNSNFNFVGYADLAEYTIDSVVEIADLREPYRTVEGAEPSTAFQVFATDTSVYRANWSRQGRQAYFLPGWIGLGNPPGGLTWLIAYDQTVLFGNRWFTTDTPTDPTGLWILNNEVVLGARVEPSIDDPWAANWVVLNSAGNPWSGIIGSPMRLTSKPHVKVLYPELKLRWSTNWLNRVLPNSSSAPPPGLLLTRFQTRWDTDTSTPPRPQADNAVTRMSKLLDFLGGHFFLLDVPYPVKDGAGNWVWGWHEGLNWNDLFVGDSPFGDYLTNLEIPVPGGVTLDQRTINPESVNGLYGSGWAWHWDNFSLISNTAPAFGVYADPSTSTYVWPDYITVVAWVDGHAGQSVEIGLMPVSQNDASRNHQFLAAGKLSRTVSLEYSGRQFVWAAFALGDFTGGNYVPYIANASPDYDLRVGALYVVPGVGPGPLLPSIAVIPRFGSDKAQLESKLNSSDVLRWPAIKGVTGGYFSYWNLLSSEFVGRAMPQAGFVLYRFKELARREDLDEFTISIWITPRPIYTGHGTSVPGVGDYRYRTIWSVVGATTDQFDDPCGGPGYGYTYRWRLSLVREIDAGYEWITLVYSPAAGGESKFKIWQVGALPTPDEVYSGPWFKSHLITVSFEGGKVSVWVDADVVAEVDVSGLDLSDPQFLSIGGVEVASTNYTSAHAWIDEVLVCPKPAKHQWHVAWFYSNAPFGMSVDDVRIAQQWSVNTRDRLVSTFGDWQMIASSAAHYGFISWNVVTHGVVDVAEEARFGTLYSGIAPTAESPGLYGADGVANGAYENWALWEDPRVIPLNELAIDNTRLLGARLRRASYRASIPQTIVGFGRNQTHDFSDAVWNPYTAMDVPVTAIARGEMGGVFPESNSPILPKIIYSSATDPGTTGDWVSGLVDWSASNKAFWYRPVQLDSNMAIRWWGFKALSSIAQSTKLTIDVSLVGYQLFTPLSGSHYAYYRRGTPTNEMIPRPTWPAWWSNNAGWYSVASYVKAALPGYRCSSGRAHMPAGPMAVVDANVSPKDVYLPGAGVYQVSNVIGGHYVGGLGSVGRIEYSEHLFVGQEFDDFFLIYGGVIYKHAISVADTWDSAVPSWFTDGQQASDRINQYWILPNVLEPIGSVRLKATTHLGFWSHLAKNKSHLACRSPNPSRNFSCYVRSFDGTTWDAIQAVRAYQVDVMGHGAGQATSGAVNDWSGWLGQSLHFGLINGSYLSGQTVAQVGVAPGIAFMRWSVVPTLFVEQGGIHGSDELIFGAEASTLGGLAGAVMANLFYYLPARIRAFPLSTDIIGWDETAAGARIASNDGGGTNYWESWTHAARFVIWVNENLGNDLSTVSHIDVRIDAVDVVRGRASFSPQLLNAGVEGRDPWGQLD